DTLGLPFVRPYLSGRSAEDFAGGANFAVGGATALSPDFFRARGFHNMGNRVDLDMEMKWFRGLLDLLCPGNLAGCSDMMNQSLFLVGEIGGNDYNGPLLSGVPFEEIRAITPSVVAKISSTISELIQLGAKTLVVPGNLPIGCVPKYLMIFKSNKKEDYDPQTGCLRWMNEFSQYHNKLLVEQLKKLRRLHPGAKFTPSSFQKLFIWEAKFHKLRRPLVTFLWSLVFPSFLLDIPIAAVYMYFLNDKKIIKYENMMILKCILNQRVIEPLMNLFSLVSHIFISSSKITLMITTESFILGCQMILIRKMLAFNLQESTCLWQEHYYILYLVLHSIQSLRELYTRWMFSGPLFLLIIPFVFMHLHFTF
ncbi:hypothetical protein ACJX0J_018494, partial [Zea mays]